MLVVSENIYGLPSKVVVESQCSSEVITNENKNYIFDTGGINFGAPGKDNYQIAIEEGVFSGTREEYAQLVGTPTNVGALETRLDDLEEATDGLVLGVDPVTYYILARDN